MIRTLALPLNSARLTVFSRGMKEGNKAGRRGQDAHYHAMLGANVLQSISF
jgi:hypothetical protein